MYPLGCSSAALGCSRANLFFSTAAVTTAAMAFWEVGMMQAETPGQFGTALRWIHVAAFVVIVSLVGFVRFYMRAGRPWLAWTVCSLRAISVLLNFLTGQNLNYREVSALRHVPFLGESVSVGEGVSNPWMLFGQLSLVLLVVFAADATITIWRRGDRRPVLVTVSSIVFFVLAATVQSVLALWQIVPAPITPSLFYVGIVMVMAYEISRDLLRAQELFRLVIDAAPAGMLTVDDRGLILLVNSQMEVISGYTRQELIGQSVGTLVPVQDRQSYADHLARYFSASEALPMGARGAFTVLRKDGARFRSKSGSAPFTQTRKSRCWSCSWTSRPRRSRRKPCAWRSKAPGMAYTISISPVATPSTRPNCWRSTDCLLTARSTWMQNWCRSGCIAMTGSLISPGRRPPTTQTERGSLMSSFGSSDRHGSAGSPGRPGQ